ncbi:sensor histidine kinase [Hwanghaeella grinnelliae]|uniref:histidine kinase n=1 Tax=Hwanghaeella grinnelliae TaxID=2500179 RepID=A0A3S2VPZ1_9PROT|nr:sensor histidine kinase [Hwanghaeella grinnelliae]RVU38908.1 sensor histidine kinase [Hwanghaeella grinnelliae]
MQDDVSVFFLLLNNISVFVVLIVGYSFLIERLQSRTALTRQAVMGLYFGLITLVSMHVKIPVVEGVIVDQRNALIVLSGAFGGPISALICGAMAGAFRMYLGGAGVVGGVFGITLSAAFGAILYLVPRRTNIVVFMFLAAAFAVVFTAPGFLLVGDFDQGLALMQRMLPPWGMAIFVGIFLGGLLLSREDQRLKSDQEKRATEAQFKTLYDGTVIAILDVDLTEIVTAFRKLREKGITDIDAFVAAGGPEVPSLDRRVIVRHANPAARALYGADSIGDMLGRFDGGFGPESGGIHPAIAHGLWYGEPSITFESKHRTFDGKAINVSISMPIPGPIDGPLEKFASLPVTVLDVTEHKKAEAARDEARRNAENASKAKSDFLAGMSHELRTPLNAILGFSEVIRDQMLGPLGHSKYGEYARHIHSSGVLLLELVNDILDIATIEAGRKSLSLRDIDLDDLVDECLAIVEHRAKEAGVSIRKQIAVTEDQSVLADRRALQQVLLNLLTNAVKYTPAGGQVAVSAQLGISEAEIVVSDTGCGIPKDRIEKVVSPFERGSDDPYLAEKGWGLGLAIAKTLVELHDGELRIDSVVGDGTSVRISLPRQTQ